jgi:hypothetical protein
MTESRSINTLTYCYSASTPSESFQKQYCFFTPYQVTDPIPVHQSITQLSKTTPFKV